MRYRQIKDEDGYVVRYEAIGHKAFIRVEYGSLSHNRPSGFTPIANGKVFRSCQRLKDAKSFLESVITFKNIMNGAVINME